MREIRRLALAQIDFGGTVFFAGRRMKRKERHIGCLDEVTITREGDSAIRYKEEGILTTHLKIGPEIAGMSEEAFLELFNDALQAQAQLGGEYKHVAVEVPLGSPQIKYFARGHQWYPRGTVLGLALRMVF